MSRSTWLIEYTDTRTKYPKDIIEEVHGTQEAAINYAKALGASPDKENIRVYQLTTTHEQVFPEKTIS